MNLNKKLMILLYCLLLSVILAGCSPNYNGRYGALDVHVFDGTPVEELAKAANKENTTKIAEIAEQDPDLLNYKEPQFDETVLYWAARSRKYKSVEQMLISGADPNIVCEKLDGPALVAAIDYPSYDNSFDESPEMVELLLKYGADPNATLVNSVYSNQVENKDILTYSVGFGLEKVKLLVEAGADVNYCNYEIIDDGILYTRQATAAEEALIYGEKETAEYLIVDKHANCLRYTDFVYKDTVNENRREYTIDCLLYWWNVYPRESYSDDDCRYALKIAAEMLRQCNETDDVEAKEYTVKKLKENFPELFTN
jgi:hypothetical protein